VYGLIASFFHMNAYLALSGAVNALAHQFGKRPVAGESATNLQWLALLTAGEGLHNNHHAAPTSAALALRRGEIDFGWWTIRALQKFKLASVRLNPADVLAKLQQRQPLSA
jgi:stearoyl-CoA desaturase (Delta-9 desaturase)